MGHEPISCSAIYGHKVVVMIDYSAVKTVLVTSSPNEKHARQWTKMFNLEVLNIVYHYGKENISTDTLSHLQHPPGIAFKQLQSRTSVNISDSKEISIQNLLYSLMTSAQYKERILYWLE